MMIVGYAMARRQATGGLLLPWLSTRGERVGEEIVMELEHSFEFISPEDLRLKGTRIGIESVLEDYLEGASPEEIAACYRNLTLEQVYATPLYYCRHQWRPR